MLGTNLLHARSTLNAYAVVLLNKRMKRLRHYHTQPMSLLQMLDTLSIWKDIPITISLLKEYKLNQASNSNIIMGMTIDSSTHFQAPPQAAYFLWSCDKVYHKQEVCFLLYFLGQIVSWQYNPNILD